MGKPSETDSRASFPNSPCPDSTTPFCLKSPPPSIHLKKILANYPEGSQIFKEALQNADDAQANTFSILIDERRHRVTTPELERFSGPALILGNDAQFSAEDWVSIQRMFESEKRCGLSKIGKFGMGSRCLFHLADVLFVASGATLAYIDPDYILTEQGGEAFQYCDAHTKKAKGKLLLDHLALFKGLLGFQPDRPYAGTIFRLPLRIGKYARTSSFAPYEYFPSKVRNIITRVHKEFPECLLFLQSLKRIEVFHWMEEDEMPSRVFDCSARECIGDTSLRDAGTSLDSLAQFWEAKHWSDKSTGSSPIRQFLSSMRDIQDLRNALMCADSGTLPELRRTIRIDCRYYVTRKDTDRVTDVKESGSSSELICRSDMSVWRVMTRICHSPEFLELLVASKSAPVVGAAAQLYPLVTNDMLISAGFPRSQLNGRLFCFLPISDLSTGLPFHLHGTFCLVDNRRDLWLSLEDTDGRAKAWSTWNELLLNNQLPDLCVNLLMSIDNDICSYASWPDPENVTERFQEFLEAFKEKLSLECPRLLKGLNHRHPTLVSTIDTDFLKAVADNNTTARDATRPDLHLLKLYKFLASLGQTSSSTYLILPPWIERCLHKLPRVSFIRFLRDCILPSWLFQQDPAFATYLPDIMIILCKMLTNRPTAEIEAFTDLVKDLRFIPAETQTSPTEIHFSEMPSNNDQNVKPERPKAPRLLSPTECFDIGLRNFRVASRAVPAGPFASADVLNVLRVWGLKQSLAWSELAREAILQICDSTCHS